MVTKWARKIVSGKKNRFEEDGYDLDLTYVTPRIVAMSFPAEGFESLYRNSIEDVAKLIRKKHNKNYLVFNLSGRKYDYLKFDGQVVDYPWEDHHSPPLHFLFNICEDIHKFLMNPKGKDTSAVAIHCLAGKGRTGTVICCYLMYCGAFSNSNDALYYYKKKRFNTGGGVTQPSQVRYVKYFEKLFFGGPLRVQGYLLNSIKFHGINDVGSLKPGLKIYEVKKSKESQEDLLLYPTKISESEKKVMDFDIANNRMTFFPPQNLFLHGDILIRLHNQSTFSTKVLFRFAFNTAFFPEDQDKIITVRFSISDMDPDKVSKDPRYLQNFCVEMSLTKIDTTIKELAEAIKEEQIYMDVIGKICKNYTRPTPELTKILLFGAEKDDTEAILKERVEEVSKFTADKFEIVQKVYDEVESEEEQKIQTEKNHNSNHGNIREDPVSRDIPEPGMVIARGKDFYGDKNENKPMQFSTET